MAVVPGGSKRRSLVLAGGGMKVAFQAGVLQVWLDEAGLGFDHVDGASGGVFNLAMLCQGMRGSEIADRWRSLPALAMVQPNWRALARPLTGESLTRLDRLRTRIFEHWGLDFDAIRASSLEATFNTYNFSRHELEVLPPSELTADLLVSCVSLPMWFPPLRIAGDTYIDAVYLSDANVEEAIRRGAEEIWVIWTVSERSEWGGGFLGNYFGVIEAAANGHFRRIVGRIEESNAAISRGEAGEFGRHIELRILRDEVPLHYLLNFNSDRFTQAVERGVRAGRAWCEREGIACEAPSVSARGLAGHGLRFREEMSGNLLLEEPVAPPSLGPGSSPRSEIGLRLELQISDFEAFLMDPEREAGVAGEVRCPALGGVRPIEGGRVCMLVDQGDFTRKEVRYELHLSDAEGMPLTVVALKRLDCESGRGPWRDATTAQLWVFPGHVRGSVGEFPPTDVGTHLGSGNARSGPQGLARLLRSITIDGGSAQERRAITRRFALLWIGSLWDVYRRRALPVSPI